MITLKIRNSYTYVTGKAIPLGSLELICEITHSVYVPKFRGRGEYKEEIHQFYDRVEHRFPTGWAPIVIEHLENSGVDLEVIDDRTAPPEIDLAGNWEGFSDRDYQEEFLSKAKETSRCIGKFPTGSGKTYIFARLIELLQTTALVIVPSKNLLNQTIREMKKFFPDEVGKIGDGSWDVKAITVALPNTLFRSLDEFDSRHQDFLEIKDFFGAIIPDEAHKIKITGAQQWYHICMAFDAYYKIGFTATVDAPHKPNRRLMEAALGRVLGDLTMKELIDDGWLAQAQAVFYELEIDGTSYTSFTRTGSGNLRKQFVGRWHNVYEKFILMNSERNDLIANVARRFADEGHTVLIAVNKVETQGKELYKRLEDIATFIHSSTKGNEEAILSLDEREISVLIGTTIGEGINIPSLDVVIRAYGQKEDKNVIQVGGRVARLSDSKKNCIIVDIYDKDSGILESHSKARMRAYKKEGLQTSFAYEDKSLEVEFVS